MSDDKRFPQRSTSPLRNESPIRRRERWREACSPLALGLLGLCLAVALWGYGSKLWLYFGPSQPAGPRVPIAKLWSEHRNGFALLASSAQKARLKPRAYADSGSPVPLPSSLELCLRQAASGQFLSERPRSVPFFHTAIPLRSPPFRTARG